MNFVLNTNILIAAILRGSTTRKLLFQATWAGHRLYIPEGFIEEIFRHQEYLIKKSRLSTESFSTILSALLKLVTIVPNQSFSKHLKYISTISPDQKDNPFLALVFHLKIPLWSNDLDLKEKQNIVTVFNTAEVRKLLEGNS